jgi:hypothetical protein
MKDSSIQVKLGSRHIPQNFTRAGRVYRVKEVQESWRLTGAWWDGEGEKTYFRVQTDKGGVFELCFDHSLDKWQLAWVED